jgi:predicted dehydrogenase
MSLAFVGCGYAASLYAQSLKKYPQLSLRGVFDKVEERANSFSRYYHVKRYQSLRELLDDSHVSIVVNLTNIREHAHITKLCLEAGKNVFSEKPLAMSVEEAEELVDLARSKAVQLACAPANILGEAAQTVWKLLREGVIGRVWLAYAEMDDGAIHQMDYHSWRSPTGAAWPFKDEFEMGCTLEHAEYQLGLLTTFFGPVKQVSPFSCCLVPQKIGEEVTLGDDLSITCLTFTSGVVARLTCSTLAPKNHSMTIVGSEGVLLLEDCWRYDSPIFIQQRLRNTEQCSEITYLSERHPVRLARIAEVNTKYDETNGIDFARGLVDLTGAIQQKTSPRLSAQQALHITEIVGAINGSTPSSLEMRTFFDQPEPMEEMNYTASPNEVHGL